jgi:hypothetical protein
MAKKPLTEYEIELVRFCAKHYLEKGEVLGYSECPKHEELGRKAVMEAIDRLMRFNLLAGFSSNGFRIMPALLEQVEEWDNPPLPDYRDRITKWFWSKPWSIAVYILVVGMPAVIGWIVMLKTILEWMVGEK